jgi:hypothetical protein
MDCQDLVCSLFFLHCPLKPACTSFPSLTVLQDRNWRWRLGTRCRLVPVESLAPHGGVWLRRFHGIEAVHGGQAFSTTCEIFTEEEELLILGGLACKRRGELAISAIEKTELLTFSIDCGWSTQRTDWPVGYLLRDIEVDCIGMKAKENNGRQSPEAL